MSGHTDGGGCATCVARPTQRDAEVPIDEKLPSQLFGSPAQPGLPWLNPAQASQDGAWPISCSPACVLHMMRPHALVSLRLWQCVPMLIAAQNASPLWQCHAALRRIFILKLPRRGNMCYLCERVLSPVSWLLK